MTTAGTTPKQAEIALQVSAVEEMLVRGYSTSNIVKRCTKEWDVVPATVYNRIKAVRDAWRAEASKIDRTAMRDAHRARLVKCYNLAVNRRVPLRDAEGNPVISERGKPYMVDEPDLRAAAKFMDSLAKLDALNEESIDSNKGQDLVTLMAMAGVAQNKQQQLAEN